MLRNISILAFATLIGTQAIAEGWEYKKVVDDVNRKTAHIAVIKENEEYAVKDKGLIPRAKRIMFPVELAVACWPGSRPNIVLSRKNSKTGVEPTTPEVGYRLGNSTSKSERWTPYRTTSLQRQFADNDEFAKELLIVDALYTSFSGEEGSKFASRFDLDAGRDILRRVYSECRKGN